MFCAPLEQLDSPAHREAMGGGDRTERERDPHGHSRPATTAWEPLLNGSPQKSTTQTAPSICHPRHFNFPFCWVCLLTCQQLSKTSQGPWPPTSLRELFRSIPFMGSQHPFWQWPPLSFSHSTGLPVCPAQDSIQEVLSVHLLADCDGNRLRRKDS